MEEVILFFFGLDGAAIIFSLAKVNTACTAALSLLDSEFMRRLAT